MSDLVQNSLAIAACLAAGLFVAWRAYKSLAGRASGCGTGCGSCASAADKSRGPVVKPLLSINAPAADEEAPRRDGSALPRAKS